MKELFETFLKFGCPYANMGKIIFVMLGLSSQPLFTTIKLKEYDRRYIQRR